MDLNKLFSQRMNANIQKSLDVAIARFERGNITGIMVNKNLVSTLLALCIANKISVLKLHIAKRESERERERKPYLAKRLL